MSKHLSKILLLLICLILIGADVYKDLVGNSVTIENQKTRRAYSRRPSVYVFDNICESKKENKGEAQDKTSKKATASNPNFKIALYHTHMAKGYLLLSNRYHSISSNNADSYIYRLRKLLI